MRIEFLTPIGALLAIGALLTLAAFAVAEARARRVSEALRLPGASRLSRVPLAVSLAAAPILLGVAAAQPVLRASHERYARRGIEAFFVFDTSRSMLASASAGSPTRFERARKEALQVRRALPDVPVGIASLTNRLLPHLFPSSDQAVFDATLERSIDIERPPPDQARSIQVTTFNPLLDLQRQNYFDADAGRRLVVVFTDGETRFTSTRRLRRALLQRPSVHTVFVHVAAAGEQVFLKSGRPEPTYQSDPQSMVKLERLARGIGGRAFPETQLGEVERAARDALGGGERVPIGRERHSYPLAPYVALACFLPLGVILRRRNV
jgi:hypothetical protein